MKDPTRLLLIRHAHADADGRLCGSFDVPVSARGLRQLEQLLRRVPRHARPAAVYGSTLRRARLVASRLARAWSLEPTLIDAIREIDCGALDGLELDAIRRDYPDLWDRNTAQDDQDFAWPGGESYRRFRARTLAGLGRIAAAHPGQRVAVVTHAGVVSQVLGTLRGRSPAVWNVDRPDPLRATDVAWGEGGPQAVVAFNTADWF